MSDIFTTVMKCLRVYVREAFPFRQSFIVFILFRSRGLRLERFKESHTKLRENARASHKLGKKLGQSPSSLRRKRIEGARPRVREERGGELFSPSRAQIPPSLPF